MRLMICGVLTDYKGRVLLQRVAPRTLAPIHRPFEIGRLPAETLARAFRDDTSLYVMPVRLTSLDYAAARDELSATFRCTMRGGDLPPEEEPTVGFFDPPPPALAGQFRPQVEQALRHAGESPLLQEARPGLLSRLFDRRKDEQREDDWEVRVRLALRDGNGAFLWTRAGEDGLWQLPVIGPVAGEPPWKAAERLLQTHLPGGAVSPVRPIVGVLAAGRPALDMVFTAEIAGWTTSAGGSILFARPELSRAFITDDVTLIRDIDWTTRACQWRIAGN